MVNLLDYLVMKCPTPLVFALLDSVIPTYFVFNFCAIVFYIIYMHVLHCAYSVWCLQCVVTTVRGAYSVWCQHMYIRTCIRMVLKPNWHTNTHSC